MQTTAQIESPEAELNATTIQAQLASRNLPPLEAVQVTHDYVYCDGSGYGDGEVYKTWANIPPALGHPRVYLTIPSGQTFIDCTYCDRRFVLAS